MPLREYVSGSGRLFFLIAGVFLIAGFLRLNDLSLYTPDSPRYVIWGNSLASGNGYVDDTQPEKLSFVFHAPLYPLLIAPVELLFPLQVEPVKIVTLLWGLCGLCLLYFWLHRLLGRSAALAGAAILAFNPMYLVYSTEVLSEAPFIAFILFVIILLTRIEKGDPRGSSAWWALVIGTACLGLLREVGVLLWLIVCAYVFGKDRKHALVVAVAGVLTLGGWYLRNAVLVGAPPGAPGANASLVLQHYLTGAEEPFLAELSARVSLNLSSYLPAAAGMSLFPLSGGDAGLLLPPGAGFSGGAILAVIVCSALAISAGMIRASVGSRGGKFLALSWFALLLAAAVYPVHDGRFLMPMLPLSIYFGLNGIMGAVAAVGAPGKIAVAVAFSAALAVVLPNLSPLFGLIKLNAQYHENPVALRDSLVQLEEYPYYYTQPWGRLKEELAGLGDPGAVIGTPAKELALVAGGRKVLELDPGMTQPHFDYLLRANGVGYLLAPVRWGDFRVYEFLMGESRRFVFTETLTAGNIHLMRVTPRQFGADHPPRTALAEPRGAVDYLRRARARIRTGECVKALDDLNAAALIAPDRPEIRFHAVVAAAMIGDTVRAMEDFRRLLSLRQVGSYLNSARYHLYLMDLMKYASELPPGPDRIYKMYDVSHKYWQHGYYDFARNLLTAEMMPDSGFFVGHLWAFHFNFQMGDTTTARLFLGRLDRIDSTNTLVQNFHRLMDLRRRVRGSANPAERAADRLRMAHIYRDIELPAESFDEAEAALGEGPGQGDALLFLAESCAAEGQPRRALDYYRRYLTLVPGDLRAAAAADSVETAFKGGE